jgi:SAM-dependent methyltransferase
MAEPRTHTGSAFDGIAPAYDDAFTRTHTGRLQRALVHAHLQAHATRPLRVLELNCGTGEDAYWLAAQGHQVLATDISAGMVAAAAAKCAGLPGVQLLQAGFAEALAAPGGPYDLILSNFGGLNCLSPAELAALGPLLAQKLAPQGHVVAVIMPRRCIWERLYFLAKLQPGKAFRRSRKSAVVAYLQDGSAVPTWYYHPSELRAAWSPALSCTVQHPVGLFLPPSYLDPLVARRPRFLAWLSRWEQRLHHQGWMAGLADHCLLEFRLPA